MEGRFFKAIRLLVVTTIIIIVGVFCIKKVSNSLEQKKYEDLKADLLLIQAKVKTIKGKADVSGNKDNYLGAKISENENNDLKDFLRYIKIKDEDFESFYVLSKVDFDTMNISDELKNAEDNEFIVNYDSSEVIYKKGIKVDGKVKYKISEINEKKLPKYWIIYNRVEVQK
ncbi:MAG: hypothetical protein IKE01_06070 [Clostridia bacterium]|nr:hypothetical protein [Clostridia bacterium]